MNLSEIWIVSDAFRREHRSIESVLLSTSPHLNNHLEMFLMLPSVGGNDEVCMRTCRILADLDLRLVV